MSTAARIEELRKKFDENPRRYFAPLANELRKAGDLSQAIALCREHLPKQPGHMSGYIVFGQALYETGELDEARSVFEQALALDPENLIALRHLGDIARRQGQAHVARRWYERVLEADPRNDDIAAQLATLNTPVQGTAAQGTPAAGTPAFGAPVYGAPAYGAPAYGAPAYGASPAIPTPIAAAPAIPTPISAAPAIPTPVAGMGAVPTPIDNVALPIDFDGMLSLTPASTPTVAPLEGLSPTQVTPAHPTPALAFDAVMPAMPTPDAAMRAVELAASDAAASLLDEANDRTTAVPDISADGFPDGSPHGSSEGAAGGSADGLLDLDELGGIGIPSAGEGEGATSPVMDAEDAVVDAFPNGYDATAEADPFAFGTVAEPSADDFANPYNGSAVDRAGADAALVFEEGLVAPEWPDTSDLVARRDTPRFATPVSVPATPDAIQAFGREVHDPVSVPLPDPEPDLGDASVSASVPGHETIDVPVASAEVQTEVPNVVQDEWQHETYDARQDAIHEQLPDEREDAELEVSDSVSAALVTPPHGADAVHESLSAHDAFAVSPEAVDAPTEEPSEVLGVLDTFEAVEQATEQSVSAEASFADVLDAVDVSTSDDTHESEAVPAALDFIDDDTGVAEDRVAEDHVAEAVAQDASPAFVTETMGELLVAQGFLDRAVTVYEELVRRRPYDPVLSSRLGELREMQEESRARVSAQPTPAQPTPAQSTPAQPTPVASFTPAMSYTPVRALTPVAARTPMATTPISATPIAAVSTGELRTARERFAALAARRVARRTPSQSATAIPDAWAAAAGLGTATPARGADVLAPAEDSLAALFGTEGEDADDLAAQQLAQAFNPDADVGSLSDSFFAGAAGHREPTPAYGVSRQPTPVRSATPIRSAAIPQPEAAPATTGEFSFDRFFPDPARSSGESSATPSAPQDAGHHMGQGTGQTPPSDPSAPPPVDDLAQFSQWLKGLGKS